MRAVVVIEWFEKHSESDGLLGVGDLGDGMLTDGVPLLLCEGHRGEAARSFVPRRRDGVARPSSTRRARPRALPPVSVDGCSRRVPQAAERLGRLTLATVVTYEAGDLAHSDERGAAEDELARAAANFGSQVTCGIDTRVLVGRPDSALVAHATDNDFDILAIGSRGRGVSKLLMGSAARHVSENTLNPGPYRQQQGESLARYAAPAVVIHRMHRRACGIVRSRAIPIGPLHCVQRPYEPARSRTSA